MIRYYSMHNTIKLTPKSTPKPTHILTPASYTKYNDFFV